LFLGFIEDNKYSVLHRIIHQHLHIHLITGKLQPVSAGGFNEGIAKPHKEHEQDEADDSVGIQPTIHTHVGLIIYK
jgi:hypothetical protein